MSEKWFDVKKAAQVAAFFVNKEGTSMPVLKLVKLIYLAGRERMKQHGYPIFNDKLVSMPHGPVNSLAYDYISGNSEHEDWDAFIGARKGIMVVARKQFAIDDFTRLSRADVQTMEKIWKQFGKMDEWELRDWTHKNCKEWENPHGSSIPIPDVLVLKFLGVPEPEERAADIEQDRHIAAIFADAA